MATCGLQSTIKKKQIIVTKSETANKSGFDQSCPVRQNI